MARTKSAEQITRATQHTASAAALATGAELSRRGYDVTFTLGNTRRVDLFCSVPDGKLFKVQVKGISNANAFYLNKSFFDVPARAGPFLVVVLVPKKGKERDPFRFFILTYAEAKKEFFKYRDPIGFLWGAITPYENNWSAFPRTNVGMSSA